jgi:hypothetical protein
MASGGGSGGSSGSGGGAAKAGAVILAILGGITGLIILTGGGGDDAPAAVGTTAPTQNTGGGNSAATVPPSSSSPQTTGFDREALRGGDPEAVVVTVAAFGLPARVSVTADSPDDVISQGMFDPAEGVDFACLPDDQYPNPCVSFVVVKRGAAVTITAGNSRAGFWPNLDRLEGGGCTMPGTGTDTDVTCGFSAFQDADVIAYYYGDTTASGKYLYPNCPVASDRGNNPPAWASRCQ